MLKGIEGVSTYAKDVDQAFIIVSGITLFLFIVTIGSMFYFVYKYRASKHAKEKTKNIKHYTPLEIAWTVIPTILMMIVFYFGLDSLRVQRTMPNDENSMQVKVLAQRWFWTFEYENGKKSKDLYVPVNSNVKLLMTAPVNDVLHSFYVPAFRAKEDVVPGIITKLWFNATKTGTFDIQCAEYCGTRHAYMKANVVVMEKEKFQEWMKPPKKIVQKTATQLLSDYGCIGCHSFDGTTLVGPSLKDIYNKEVQVEKNGKIITLKRDENYLKNAILKPNDELVVGFPANMMPSFDGQIKEDELEKIISHLKGTKEKKREIPPKKEKLNGKTLVENNGCLGCHSLDGSRVVGPSFKNLFNKTTKVLENGKEIEIKVDELYLKDSILNPKKQVAVGYPNIMPAFKAILKDEEVDAIVEYLKTIKE